MPPMPEPMITPISAALSGVITSVGVFDRQLCGGDSELDEADQPVRLFLYP